MRQLFKHMTASPENTYPDLLLMSDLLPPRLPLPIAAPTSPTLRNEPISEELASLRALAWTRECPNAPLGSLTALHQSLATADGVDLAEKLVLLLSNAIPALHSSDDPQNPFVLLLTSRLENYRKLWAEALVACVDDDSWRYVLLHAGGTQCTQLSLLFSDVYSRTASLSAAAALKLARYIECVLLHYIVCTCID